MPKGIRISDAIKRAALRDYYEGSKTVDRIAAEYGICRRRIYDWTQTDKVLRKHNKRTERKGLRLSLEETEYLLLLLAETETIARPKDTGLRRNLEDRLLQIADDLYRPTND